MPIYPSPLSNMQTTTTQTQNSQTITRDSSGRFTRKYAYHTQYRDSNGRFVDATYATRNPTDVFVTSWRQPRKTV
jgi:hypothetical protein